MCNIVSLNKVQALEQKRINSSKYCGEHLVKGGLELRFRKEKLMHPNIICLLVLTMLFCWEFVNNNNIFIFSQ